VGPCDVKSRSGGNTRTIFVDQLLVEEIWSELAKKVDFFISDDRKLQETLSASKE
jgi:hypothetical protein